MVRVDQQLTTVGASLARSDERMLTGRNAAGRVWKTGFGGLDPLIGGGMRAGSLILLAGPQGLGKSTFALQVARNNAASGRPVLYFSYEHDAEDMTQKLIAMEAGELDESDMVRMTSIRSIFDDLWVSSLDHRLESVPSGVEALAKVSHYSEMLFVHRSTGTRTDLAAIQAAIDAVRELGEGFAPAMQFERSHGNRRREIGMATEHGPVVVVQVAGLLARRIVGWIGPGQPVAAGQKLGMITFGSRTDPRDRGGRQGGAPVGAPDARQRPPRLERAGLRGRRRAGAQQQVRHRRAPPPDLRPRQRRALQGLRRPHRREEPIRTRRRVE